jgi:uncharacterized RDD family membrane protein YckC
MARWRDVKKGKVSKNDNTRKQTKQKDQNSSSIVCASALDRTKAFITDMFMIMMPIMYITTYLVMEGKEEFQASDTAHWITMAVYGVITVIFWVKKGQTPGFKAYDIKLIDDQTNEKPTLGIAIARYMMFIVSAVSIVGFLLPLFRKDKKTLQDVVLQTSVIKLNN